jgi:hypothetical protein
VRHIRRELPQKAEVITLFQIIRLKGARFSLPFLFSVKNTLRLRTKTTIFEMSLI